MSEDFFSRIDKMLSSQEVDRKTEAAQADAAEKWATSAISKAREIAKHMQAELRNRGISSELSGSGTTITFVMKFRNGDRHSLYAGLDRPRKGIEYVGYYTEGGKDYSGTTGELYPESQWTESGYEQRLQKHVEDYISFAPRHGGTV